MSSSTAIPASKELLQLFKQETDSESSSLFAIQVQIKDEQLIVKDKIMSKGTTSINFNSLATKDEGSSSYFLFKSPDHRRKWNVVCYIPDTAPVKDKMIYAATLQTLKNHLGSLSFVHDYTASSKDELKWQAYQDSFKKVYSLSKQEELLNTVKAQEEAERSERKGNFGGYHAVAMPPSPSARSALSSFAQSSANFVELRINDKKDAFDGTSKTVDVNSFARQINNQEPRFYLLRHSTGNYFVYCCPDASDTKWRMVYSTAKPSVFDSCKKEHNITFSNKLEIREGSDLVSEVFKPKTGSSKSAVYSSSTSQATQARPKSSNIATTPHPVYNLMVQGGAASPKATSSPKKGVVIPPPGAW